ncbi:uncharacterized protein Dana_GF27016, isoform B [Drosophila ananassae]|uniref:Uncharacterized protein, isoform B n=2 Tax=Drosophila ananassae TaxID=7217 RepID=A0A0N8P140_DROAN|nr:uncharacterized protein LOC26514425 [Drosophila ananassae]KPU78860.1 uncharacterized protein Dana_GF27016, isoform B [Drosophila ananassae]
MCASINITDLPLNVLDSIYEKLSIKDKINLADSDKYLEQVFLYHGKKKFSRVSDKVTDVGLYLFRLLPMFGSTINEVTLYEPTLGLMSLVGQNCSNLNSFQIALENEISVKWFNDVLKNLKNLKSINMYLDSDPCDMLEDLKSLKHLQKLKICYGKSIEKSEIHKLENLKELTIEPVNRITIETNELSNNLQFLKCKNLNIFSTVLTNKSVFTFLERLEIDFCDIRPGFPDCPNLKFLRLYKTHITEDGILKWMKDQMQLWRSYFKSETLLRQQSIHKILPIPGSVVEQFRVEEIFFPFPNCPHLKILCLDYNLLTEHYDWVTENAKSVEELRLHFGTREITDLELPFFENIREISITSGPLSLVSDSVYDWISDHASTLTTLRLNGLQEDHFSLFMLRHCKKLRSLSLGNGIHTYVPEFWMAFFDILHDNGMSSKDPLRLTIIDCQDVHKMRLLSRLRNFDCVDMVFV